jgi:hypothetical protein
VGGVDANKHIHGVLEELSAMENCFKEKHRITKAAKTHKNTYLSFASEFKCNGSDKSISQNTSIGQKLS